VPRLGVTVGKFYPPHRGHKRLIDYAESRCDELVVLVGARPQEDPPAAVRVKWLQALHRHVRFELVDDIYPEDPNVWAEVAIQILGRAPDVAFAGEMYGAAWAAAMGCLFEMVDRAQDLDGCSGTSVRADPLGRWECLEPIVRAHYVKRVCAVGAESSGTTTIARDLAAHYQTAWVPEYGRNYYECRVRQGEADRPWTTAEFVHIANEQARLEDLGALAADRVLICDTDPFATEIWHERYVGSSSSEVAAIAATRRYDLYLLTAVDIPFVQDGLRDGETIRNWMHQRFEGELARRGKPFVVLEGGPLTRLTAAIEKVDQVIGLSRLYRPVGPKELDLIRESGWRRFPPRLAGQPIFYPVLNFVYAERIARDWNVPDSGYGAVTSFWIRRDFLSQYEVHQVGGPTSREYWIAAGDIDLFNANIVGPIEVVREYTPASPDRSS
jgi:HTH-type transcriptional regulator, transcriptional repressor of NAD biosynthesis genes